MITQFCVAILVTFNVNVTLCHCTVTQVTQVIDFVARARFKSQVWLWLETRVMCRAPWKLVSRKLARYLLGSTNPHPCSPVAANGQWSHWNYCPLRCFELHVRRQIDTMCQTHQTSLVSEQVTPLSLYQYNITLIYTVSRKKVWSLFSWPYLPLNPSEMEKVWVFWSIQHKCFMIDT